MKVLITGANGQLGRALRRSAPESVAALAFDVDKLDITQPQSVKTVQELAPDIIVNAAAYTAVDRAESEPEAAHAVNGTGAGYMAQAAQRIGSRLVHISTDFVFDGRQGRPYRPDDEPNPLNVYGASKLAGERAVLAQCPNALILRTAWVYAEEGRNFLVTMLRLMCERESLRVVDDQIGTPTYATSLARAIWRAVNAGLQGVHHWTDAGVASWYDFAVAIQERSLDAGLLDRPVQISPVGSEAFTAVARRPSMSVLDKRSGYDILGSGVHWRRELDHCLGRLMAMKSETTLPTSASRNRG